MLTKMIDGKVYKLIEVDPDNECICNEDFFKKEIKQFFTYYSKLLSKTEMEAFATATLRKMEEPWHQDQEKDLKASSDTGII